MTTKSQSKAGFVAVRTFRFGGRSFRPGDAFPWRELSCSHRRLRQLQDHRMVMTHAQHQAYQDKRDADVAAREYAEEQARLARAAREMTGPPLELIQRGSGWIEVFHEGKPLTQPKKARGLEAATQLCEKLSAEMKVPMPTEEPHPLPDPDEGVCETVGAPTETSEKSETPEGADGAPSSPEDSETEAPEDSENDTPDA